MSSNKKWICDGKPKNPQYQGSKRGHQHEPRIIYGNVCIYCGLPREAVVTNAARGATITNARGATITNAIEAIVANAIKKNTKKHKQVQKNYRKLSIIGIMRERKDNQKNKTIFLLLMATIIYIFASKFLNFSISNIFICVLLGSVLLIVLELFIFNYRVNKGWFGSSELEAKEIIRFIIKQSEDIDFTDGNSPKAIIRPEDIQQIGEELGIQFPGYPQPNAINKGFSEG